VTYPARVQLIAAMNPCRCGHLANATLACRQAPRCAADYQRKLSGPLLDRIDMYIEVAPVPATDLWAPANSEPSAAVAARVAAARQLQRERLFHTSMRSNAEMDAKALDAHATPDAEGPVCAKWHAALPILRAPRPLGAPILPKRCRIGRAWAPDKASAPLQHPCDRPAPPAPRPKSDCGYADFRCDDVLALGPFAQPPAGPQNRKRRVSGALPALRAAVAAPCARKMGGVAAPLARNAAKPAEIAPVGLMRAKARTSLMRATARGHANPAPTPQRRSQNGACASQAGLPWQCCRRCRQ